MSDELKYINEKKKKQEKQEKSTVSQFSSSFRKKQGIRRLYIF